ncbi:cytochrome C oxidase subunit IV family protein [Primorskyibacter sp. S87]|uniref:cytochrome C oxidase subunit IV family protein n=1 Tax=Primorskyibacter sp. S87 TaxID=3415126 RepID=UPI003C7D226A
MPTSSSKERPIRQRHSDPLAAAWLLLLVLSLTAAALTMLPVPPKAIGVGILLLALVKARVILSRYLELRRCPVILRGFTVTLTGFVLLVGALLLL